MKGNFVQDILTQQMNCLTPLLLWYAYTYFDIKCTSNIFTLMKLFLCGKENQFFGLAIKFFPRCLLYDSLCNKIILPRQIMHH